MTTVLKIKIAKMFPLLIINEDISYKITLAWDQRWAIISTGIVTSLNPIIPQDRQARNEWYLQEITMNLIFQQYTKPASLSETETKKSQAGCFLAYNNTF